MTRRLGWARLRVFRGASLVALVAVLACSGLGVCWLQFVAARAHDCCDQAETGSMEPGRACSALGVRVDGATVAPPAVQPFDLDLPALFAVRALDVAAPADLPSRPPPLVLRI